MKRKDYKVGYGRPPVEHQFGKGKSGNPGGRTSGARGLKTDLIAELNAKETIRIGDKNVSGTRQRQALRTLSIRAAKGDLKAIAQLIPLIVQVLGVEDRGTSEEKLSNADQALLDALLDEPTGDIVEQDDNQREGQATNNDADDVAGD